MDFLSLVMLMCVAYLCFRAIVTFGPRRWSRSGIALPPGPRGFPIIGNILQLDQNPHMSVAELAKTYGPVMSLKLGSITTIVISSPEAAKEALHTNDRAMSGRAVPSFIRVIGHDKYSLSFLPATPQWRQLRKIAAVQMLSTQRLDSTKVHRADKVQKLVKFVRESCSKGEAVNIGEAAFTTTLNLITTTLFSIDIAPYGSGSYREFHEAVCGLMEEAGKQNLVDFFPVLGFFDLPFVSKRGTVYKDKLMNLFQEMIDERSRKRSMGHKENNDVLDSLLDILTGEKDFEFNEYYMKHMLLDLFVAGIDTSSTTMEWAMTELLRQPEKMAKAQTEVRQVVGPGDSVEESDIAKLPYLQSVVKETLRLHPPAPFLVPRRAEADVEVHGYMVPKDAAVWVNVWAMGRDPSLWTNPDTFEPERFLERENDVKGRDFEFIPFGAGRRVCPGQPLAHRMVHLVLASLLHEFNWKLADGLKAEDVDMGDKFGITLHKAVSLRAAPIEI